MFLLLFFVSIVPGIFGTCLQIPVQKLPPPCSIRNLIIMDTSGRTLCNDNLCNGTVYSEQLIDPPSVNFSSFSASSYRDSTFLMVFVNTLSTELLWMVGNITTKDNRLVPKFDSSTAITLKYYSQPTFNATKRIHQIDVYVFAVKGNAAASFFVHQQEILPYNLTKWLSRQLSYRIQICGPVAAAQFMVIDSRQIPSSNFYPPAGQPVWKPAQTVQNEPPHLYPNLPPNIAQRPTGNGNFYPTYPGHQQSGNSPKRNAAICLYPNMLIIFFVILNNFGSIIN